MRVRVYGVVLALVVGACTFPDYRFGAHPNDVTAPACSDGELGPGETGVDCGGVCPVCPVAQPCTSGADCESKSCVERVCQAASCHDGLKNGSETSIDCGGSCEPCADTSRCGSAADCRSGVCTDKSCRAPTCIDGVVNGSETGVDCGGGCPACTVGLSCKSSLDCASGACAHSVCVAPSCTDGTRNGDESDVDCGGANCAPCATAHGCQAAKDCESANCQRGTCMASTCSDHIQNQAESDVDCGGPSCPACDNGRVCTNASDCASTVCQSGTCVPAAATGQPLSPVQWTASASASAPDSPASNAFDGDIATRWSSGTRQAPGIAYTLDLGSPQIFFSFTLNATNFADDGPLGFDVYFSNDGTFSAPARSNMSGAAITHVAFESAIVARYIRIELTAGKENWWSIGELSVER